MKKVVIASVRPNAGKTGIITGIAGVLEKKIGYMKPFGDRLIYRKKRFWDSDSALMTQVFKLTEDPGLMSIGFDQSKVGYMPEPDLIKGRLLECMAQIRKDRELLFLEGGGNLWQGISVLLDPVSVAKHTGAKLYIIVSGEPNTVIDDVVFLNRHFREQALIPDGIIINRLPDPEEFRGAYLPKIAQLGLPIVGIIPFRKELLRYTVRFLADRLFTKVLAGERNLKRTIENILVGAMSAESAAQSPLLRAGNTVFITGGDRPDLIRTALQGHPAAVVATGNIQPEPEIVALAEEKGTPLLSAGLDAYEIARQIEAVEPPLNPYDRDKIELWKTLVRENLDLGKLAPVPWNPGLSGRYQNAKFRPMVP